MKPALKEKETEKESDKEKQYANLKGSSADVVTWAIRRCAELGIEDWEKYLPDASEFTTREVLHAIGKAMAKAGIPNNLEQA